VAFLGFPVILARVPSLGGFPLFLAILTGFGFWVGFGLILLVCTCNFIVLVMVRCAFILCMFIGGGWGYVKVLLKVGSGVLIYTKVVYICIVNRGYPHKNQ